MTWRPGERCISIVALCGLLPNLLPADEVVPPSPAPAPADSVTLLEASGEKTETEEFDLVESLDRDLTVIRTRTDLLSEFTDQRGSAWLEKLTLGSTLGFYLPGMGPEHEWGVRLQVPLAIADPGLVPDDGTEAGLGDVELKAGWAFVPDEVNRVGLFGNLKFDTATDDLLGDDRNDFSVGAAYSHQVIENRFSIFMLAEYLGTLTREEDVSARSALELSFKPIVKIVGPLAASFLFKDKLDFKADEHFAIIEPGLSLLLERHVGLSTSIEIPLDDESYNYVAKISMVWFY